MLAPEQTVVESAPQKEAPEAEQPKPSAEVPLVSAPGLNAMAEKELRLEAEDKARKAEFIEAVLAARALPERDYVTPAVPERIAAQTNAEMIEGARLVALRAQQDANRPPPPPPADNGMKAVFNPGDYVPDQKKGQGHVPNTSFRSLS